MENTNTTLESINTAATEAVAKKRRRLTDEERAARAEARKQVEERKAARKEAHAQRVAQYEKELAERRTITIDAANMAKVFEATKNLNSVAEMPIADARANIRSIINAAIMLEKQMYHKSDKSRVILK